ncbi:MAG: type II secretion system protein, partial [Fibrobacter sp.]|nr:type II secretion system protein [Fibrobacter sp.]
MSTSEGYTLLEIIVAIMIIGFTGLLFGNWQK